MEFPLSLDKYSGVKDYELKVVMTGQLTGGARPHVRHTLSRKAAPQISFTLNAWLSALLLQPH
jgi:hypothetical protein